MIRKKGYLILFLFYTCLSFSEVVSIGNYTFDITQKNITVPIEINTNTEFVGFQINLSFDPKVLDVSSIRIGEIVSFFNVLNNKGPGFVRIAGFSKNLQGITGSGVLAYIDFLLLNSGSSNLILSGKVSDKQGKTVPFTFLSGKIDVTGQSSLPLNQIGKIDSQTSQTKNAQLSFSQTQQTSQQTFFPAIQYPSQTAVVPVYNYPQVNISQPVNITSQQKFIPPPEDPSTKDNCVLLIISEYGNPVPANGIYTYKKGDRVECKVEKEVVIEGEKYICNGYEGYGSIEDGNENYINFTITTNTKIKWKWRKERQESP
ncbi:MAG: cohesin domain-containing protein [Candidatus Omnitrophica bacterium]|nr:cohesin domain-containing protein [Candidatus Omnitrophota bacterium]MCM8802542.1 cohesin domain-containing protein [Candidatus Omnitrophota bacterium]